MKFMVKKILYLMLIVSFVAFGFGCCKGKGTCGDPAIEHPSKCAGTNENPTGD